jgi:hypothetical protein
LDEGAYEQMRYALALRNQVLHQGREVNVNEAAEVIGSIKSLLGQLRSQIDHQSGRHVSKTGASVSKRLGPFTVSWRGRVTLRLGRGWSCRIR